MTRLQSGESIGHYELLEPLGEGSMGLPFKARDRRLERFVALKFLPKGDRSSEDFEARFLSEAQTASKVNHPNVCIIFDIERVTELEEGVDASDL